MTARRPIDPRRLTATRVQGFAVTRAHAPHPRTMARGTLGHTASPPQIGFVGVPHPPFRRGSEEPFQEHALPGEALVPPAPGPDQPHRLRPLGRVVVDRAGRLYELLPVGEGRPAPVSGNQDEVPRPAGRRGGDEAGATESTPAVPSGRIDRVFAEPGLRREMRFGDFQADLAPWMAHPERLPPDAVVACHLQVYQTLVPSGSEAIPSGGPQAPRARALTRSAASRLGVPELFLAPPTGLPLPRPGRPRVQRSFLLRPAGDPSLKEPVRAAVQSPPRAPVPADRGAPDGSAKRGVSSFLRGLGLRRGSRRA
jgi:hypothetical protein